MHVELWPIAKIHPYANNPRLNDDAVAAVAASIREFGWRQPIVVDSGGVIICGHTRYKAAQHLGLTEVPVHVARDLTPAQIRAYRIADNQTASLAEGNLELLPIELTQLQSMDFDLGLLGFGEDELAKIFNPLALTASATPTKCRNRQMPPSRSLAICGSSAITGFSAATVPSPAMSIASSKTPTSIW